MMLGGASYFSLRLPSKNESTLERMNFYQAYVEMENIAKVVYLGVKVNSLYLYAWRY